MAEPLIHLVCGSTGAGKTTFAAALAARIGGLRFSLDDWMARLFYPDQAPGLSYDWTMERIGRATAQMQAIAAPLARLGVPSVFDCGFTSAEDRAPFADWAEAEGFATRLHVLELAPEARWARVEKRNAEQGESFAFAVTREMFDFVETLWEPPTEAEARRFDIVKAAS